MRTESASVVCVLLLLLTMATSVGCGNWTAVGGTTSGRGCAASCTEDSRQVASASRIISQLCARLNLSSAVVIQSEGDELELQISVDSLQSTLVNTYEVSQDTLTDDVLRILSVHNKLTPQLHYFIVSCNLECVREFLVQVNNLDRWGPTQGVLTHRCRWLFVLQPDELRMLEPFVGNITHVTAVVRATNITQSQNSTNNTDISHRLYSCYWTPLGRQFLETGFFRKGFLQQTAPIFPNEAFGFNNRTFIIIVNMWPPFLAKRVHADNTATYDGMCIEILNTISSAFNFSYVLVEPPDGGWGTLEGDNWTGIVRQLHHKVVDISFAPLAVSTLRESVVDFAFPFYLEYSAVLYGRRDSTSKRLSFFLLPFHWIVWVLLAVATAVAAAFIVFLAHHSPCEQQRHLAKGWHAFWFTLGAFFNQSTSHIPMAASTRLLIGFYWFFCIVLVATYGGNLVAFLTISHQEAPFSTLEQVSLQEEYQLGTIAKTIWDEMLSTSNTTVYKRIWRSIQNPKIAFNVLHPKTTAHIARAKEGGYAVISDVTTFEMTEGCSIAMMQEKFFPMRYAIAMQNNSAYRELLSNIVIVLHESGLLDIWKQRYWPRPQQCATSNLARSIVINDLLGIFYLSAYILGLSILIFLAEFLIHKFMKQRHRASVVKDIVCNLQPVQHRWR